MSRPLLRADLAQAFRDKIGEAYGEFLRACGMDSGDIAPDIFVQVEEAESTLADAVVSWVLSATDEADAVMCFDADTTLTAVEAVKLAVSRMDEIDG